MQQKGRHKNYFIRKSSGFYANVKTTWKGMMGSWTWTSWVRFFISHLGDSDANMLTDTKEMKTEQMGKLDEHPSPETEQRRYK